MREDVLVRCGEMSSIPELFAISALNFVFFLANKDKERVIGYLNLFISGMVFGAAIIRYGLTTGWYKL